jgi:hypothetical protein
MLVGEAAGPLAAASSFRPENREKKSLKNLD